MAGNTAWPANTNANRPKLTGNVLACRTLVSANPGGSAVNPRVPIHSSYPTTPANDTLAAAPNAPT